MHHDHICPSEVLFKAMGKPHSGVAECKMQWKGVNQCEVFRILSVGYKPMSGVDGGQIHVR